MAFMVASGKNRLVDTPTLNGWIPGMLRHVLLMSLRSRLQTLYPTTKNAANENWHGFRGMKPPGASGKLNSNPY